MSFVALQDENHRIIDSAGQWMIQHRSGPGKMWANDAFCVTRRGVEFFLECEATRHSWTFLRSLADDRVDVRPPGSGVGYLPLHLWAVSPRLPVCHPG